jgi:hypothetical protein
VVASCASLEGFEVDDLGGVRLLVDSAFHALWDIGTGPVEIGVRSADRAIGIEMSALRRPGRRWDGPGTEALESIASVVAPQRTFAELGGRFLIRTTLRARVGG